MANYNIDAIYNGSTSLPGTERIRIDGSGNVGINQSSPAYKLDVNGTARIANDMLATGNITIGKAAAYLILDGTNSDAEIYWRANSSNRWAAGMNVGDATENFNIYNYTTATTNFTILKANGNVGIGSTAPAYKLDVNGVIASSGTPIAWFSGNYNRIFEPAGNPALYLGNNSDPANYYDNGTHFFRNRGGSSTYAVIEGNGNLGIGTTSVTAPLHIYRASNPWIRLNGGGNYSYIRFDDGTSNGYLFKNTSSDTSNGALAGAMYTYTDSGKAFQHIHGGTPLFTILSGGNVGIGTTSPAAKFQVGTHSTGDAGNGDNSANVRIGAASAGARVYGLTLANTATATVGNDSSISFIVAGNYSATGIISTILRNTTTAASDLVFTNYNNGLNERMRIQYDGNVGIGTSSPIAKLDINGTTNFAANVYHSVGGQKFFAGSGGANAYFYTGTSALNFVNSNDTSTLMTILNGGNVGIGTTVSAEKLSVEGSIILAASDGTSLGSGRKIRFYRASDGWEPAQIEQIWTGGGYQGVLAFKTNTGALGTLTTKMVINNDGNVGIGTSSPNYPIDLQSTTSPLTLNLKLNKASTTNDYAEVAFQLWSGAGSGANTFGGAGTSRPSVVLRALNENTSSAAGAFIVGTFTGGADNTTLNERFRISSVGNVGIGTTSPNAKLVIDSGEPRFRLNISGTNHIILNHDGSTAVLRTESNTPFTFGTNGTEKMRIAEGGNVGIGTSNPISLLQIAGTTSMFPTYDSVTGYSYFLRMGYDTSGSYDYTIKRNGTTGFLEFNGTQGSPYVSYVFAGGDVYSGASGGTVGGFYFNSSSHGIRRATGTNDVYCFTTSGTLYLGAGGSSTTHVRVLSGGDVGIGVSPSYKLDVNGNIHGTGFPTSSDVRFKKNITPLQNSLEKIKKLQGVKYEWNEFVNSRRDGYKLNIPIIGLIAQDVEQVVPEIVDHWKLSDDCQDARSIDYPRLIPLLIEAIKEQQNQIEELRNEIKSLKSN